MLFIFGRVGEATNPGPSFEPVEGEQPDTMPVWLGCFNPSGLTSRATSFLELPQGVWGSAETQLSQHTFNTFRRDLRSQAKTLGRSSNIIHGGFAPLRPGSETCGAWTGVAFLADHSLRPLNVPWHGLEYVGGRALCAEAIVGPHHLLGGVIYAPPSGPTFGSTTTIANELLSCLTENLVHGATGFRWICGDFNRDIYALSTFDVWRAAGWQEVQELALNRWGRLREPTSKGKAISDHLWISPELAVHLRQVETFDELFVDHAALGACFALPMTSLSQCI